MLRAKIAIVGPQQVGKTTIANFLADKMTESTKTTYRPTQGVRILEFESEAVSGKRSDATVVELWDVSGDQQFEACWPAIARGVHGVVLMFNVDQEGQENELDIWFKKFIKDAGLRSHQVLVMANKIAFFSQAARAVEMNKQLSKARLVYSNLEEDPDYVRSSFNALVAGVRKAIVESRDKEEMSILNH
eukprot:m.324035 g.324035  ORF g.324035 m.324035 type:complete len:189 (-) comp31343_c0_seq1:68-634(-)